jgi:hypothetical protein
MTEQRGDTNVAPVPTLDVYMLRFPGGSDMHEFYLASDVDALIAEARWLFNNFLCEVQPCPCPTCVRTKAWLKATEGVK